MMMRFVVDGMLGKVVLWLRLTGHDAIYRADADDDLLLSLAETEGRVLLTSDAMLESRARERHVETMLVKGDVDIQVASVFNRFEIKPEMDPSMARCSKCNGELDEIGEGDRERIRPFVHDRTFNHYQKFWLCRDCSSVYFQGGQWSNMEKYMQRIVEVMSTRIDSTGSG